MLGAIVGDIVGSIYEWNNIKTKDFPLFQDRCFFTDDTVMTCAVAEAVMNGGKREDFIRAMKKYGRMYPDSGYGTHFAAWLMSDDRGMAFQRKRPGKTVCGSDAQSSGGHQGSHGHGRRDLPVLFLFWRIL